MQTPRSPQILALAASLCVAASASADTAVSEIEYLLTTVGQSGCSFVRNGKEHASDEAESHLRMKYRKGARYIGSAETFIDKVASTSSWTQRPYRMRCPDGTDRTTAIWLHNLLDDYRRAGPEKVTSH